jgi:hypothetical protein
MQHFRFGPIYAMLMVVSLVNVSGCIFDTREPELPGATVDYVDASDPGNVVFNLEQALTELDPGGYISMLSPDFRYEPDGGTLANYSGVDWENWGYEEESAFIGAFLSNVTGVTANLNLEIVDGDESGTGTEALVRYISSTEVQEGGGEVKYRSSTTMEFRIEGTFWTLVRWFDEQGETDPDTNSLLPTLGQRRGAFAASGGR